MPVVTYTLVFGYRRPITTLPARGNRVVSPTHGPELQKWRIEWGFGSPIISVNPSLNERAVG